MIDISYKNKAGIYKITNLKNNKFYIGSSENLYKRVYEHFRLLKNNKHINLILQRSFNKNGIELFKTEVIEIFEDISRKDLLSVEQSYLDKYRCFLPEIGYNYNPKSTSVNFTDEVKAKISKANKGRPAYNKGKKMDNNQVELLKKVRSENVSNIDVYDIYGNKLYKLQSIHACVRAFNIDKRSIQRTLKGEYSMFKGLIFRFENDPFDEFLLKENQLYKYNTAHYYRNLIVNSDELLESYVNYDMPISSEAIDHSIERSETTGEKMDSLNNQIQRPTPKTGEDIVHAI